MKIAFIGGGSVQWTPKLVTDIALTETLAGANLVLHDIDADALELLTRACERIVVQVGGSLQVTATLDRAEALRGADFVILCVAIGGLPAVRNDLEIPERYGIYQPVGDTVGPGGLARGLRHIPFAVQVAREMQQLCPDAWMLNVTNPNVARQELIVEAALTNQREPALAALATDPLVRDPATVEPLLDELLKANAAFKSVFQ